MPLPEGQSILSPGSKTFDMEFEMTQKKKAPITKGAVKKQASKKPVAKAAAKTAPIKKSPAVAKAKAKVATKPAAKPAAKPVAKPAAKKTAPSAKAKTTVKTTVKAAPKKAPAAKPVAAPKKAAPAPTPASAPKKAAPPPKAVVAPKKAAPSPKPAPAPAPAPAPVKVTKPAPVAKPAPAPVAAKAAPEPKKRAKAAVAPEDLILKPAPRLPFVPEPEEDNDGPRSLALLSGPRNVKPYLAKKGEQYMGKEQLEHFRTILSVWKRDLMMEVDRTVTHMKDEAANPPDPNDRATLESEFSLELRTRDRERKLIRKIDQALERVEDGSYGYCLETGEEIGIKRLEARPVATLSIEAQERRERREKQYGDRDDRYR